MVRDSIQDIQATYAKTDKRRTLIESEEDVAFTEDDFIVEEDNVVIVSRDGWVKRQKEVRDLSTTRLREGDSVLAVLPGMYACDGGVLHELRCRVHVAHHRRARLDGLRRTGAEAVQAARRRARDCWRSVWIRESPATSRPRRKARSPKVHALAVTSDGYSLRFGLDGFVEPSTRAGRRYARPSDGVEVVGVATFTGDEIVIAATEEARAILCRADEVNYLSGPGKGVILDQAPPARTRCSASSRRLATATSCASRPRARR